MDEILVGTVIASTLRASMPLIYCALAGVLAERSGVVDLGLEGKMLSAAFAAAASGVASGSLVVALGTACLVGMLLSWLHGYACVTHRGDQVVSGMALNIIAAGLTVVLGIAWFQQGGQTPPVPESVRIKPLGDGILAQNAMVYFAFFLVAAVWWLLYRTRFGLRLRAVGENPGMVEAAGVSVLRLRYTALTLNGILCGLGGAYLVLAQNAAFGPNMTAGRGYMALAAMIFGRWRPVPCDGRVPALRLPRHGRRAAAGREAAGDRRDPGPGDPGAAVSPHRRAARRIHRPQRRAPRARPPLRQRTLSMATSLDPKQIDRLLEAAREAQRRAHAPYSRFHVGAAVLDEQGRIHAGCNVENAAYPLGTCAEAAAITAMVMAGGKRAAAMLVVGDGSTPPCGGCRQRLREFAADDAPIFVADRDRLHGTFTLGELLPMSFGPEHLLK
jgi:simple sugar transport system permease protein